MERHLNTPVKEAIDKFPKLGAILEEYQIGCVPCNVGTCLLKDVIAIHNVSEEVEAELMARIAAVFYPDRVVPVPKMERKPKSVGIKYSPPIKKLVDEHALIKRWIALIPRILENLNVNSSEDRQLLSDGIDYIRSYADRFHHAKEEDILFKYSDENLDIIKAMLKDHASAREHVSALAEAVTKRDKQAIIEHLRVYGELLTEHIKKEDEILYPWIDRNLSTSQVGELFSKFDQVDELSGNEVTERGRLFVIRVEGIFKQN